jgi:hypothetical protein
MAKRFVGDVSKQSLAPGRGLSLAFFVCRHGGIARAEVLTNDKRAGKIIQEAADAPPTDDPMQTVVHLSIDSDGEFLRHRDPPIRIAIRHFL